MTEYTPWVTRWIIRKIRSDGRIFYNGREYPTEADARAVADRMVHTETSVEPRKRVNPAPLPSHLSVTWDDIETGFHEYASQLTKEEQENGSVYGTSYPPEFADWVVGMKAAQEWLAAHDARVAREALDGLIEWCDQMVAERAQSPYARAPYQNAAGFAEGYRDTHYPEETP